MWPEKLDEIAPVSKRKKHKLNDDLAQFPKPLPHHLPTPFSNVTYKPRGYTKTAILVLILYLLMWLPGLIVNVITLNQAKKEEKRTGRKPEGKGCLSTMLWVNELLIVGGCLLGILLVVASSDAGFDLEELFLSRLDHTRFPAYGSWRVSPVAPLFTDVGSGGPVDVWTMFPTSDNCRGYADVAPDINIYVNSGDVTHIEMGFNAYTSGADTTLIVRAPNGDWYCDDDSGGDLNPYLNLRVDQSGKYDVWVGSYSEGSRWYGEFYAMAD
jgi:hypothetical protein